MVPSPLGDSPPSGDQITSNGGNRGPNRARSASQGPSQSLGTVVPGQWTYSYPGES